MLMIDADGVKWLVQLERELAWLRESHPDKTALIGVAEGHLKTIRAAGSCDSFSTNLKPATSLKKVLDGVTLTPFC